MKWTDKIINELTEEFKEEEQIAIKDQKHADVDDIGYHIGREDAYSILSKIQKRYIRSDVNPLDYFEGFFEAMFEVAENHIAEMIEGEDEE